MTVNDHQVRLLKMTFEKSGDIQQASAKAGICRQTGSKYLHQDDYPSRLKKDRIWRTRPDPFFEHWAAVESMLDIAPELEAKTLFDWLCESYPDKFQENQLRTFQRHICKWRALHGPEKEVFFPQIHYPGNRMSTDFTSMNAMGVTISGNEFKHKLCHCVLTFSNWEWATVCFSESILALRKGIQSTLSRLGHTPKEHWTDNCTAATHKPSANDEDSKRKFNPRYQALMDHYGMVPRTIQVNSPEENGDVESLNGVLKNRLKQHLLLRGNRNFESIEAYEEFLQTILNKSNNLRRNKLTEDLAAMPVLRVALLPEYELRESRVSNSSTVNILRNIYSVPSRLIGKKIRAKCYEDRIEIFYSGIHQLTAPRPLGRGSHHIDYRHIIGWLIRKPGAFNNYRYHSSLFPTSNFRKAYDRLLSACTERVATLDYLRILKHAAENMQADVDAALILMEEESIVPRWEKIQNLCSLLKPALPNITMEAVNLKQYDSLLQEVCA